MNASVEAAKTSVKGASVKIKLDDLNIIAQHFFAFERFVRTLTGNDQDIHQLLFEIMEQVEAKGIKDKGFFLKDIDGKTLSLEIVKGLRAIIDEHGPLQKLFIGAATKRIVNNLLGLKGKLQ